MNTKTIGIVLVVLGPVSVEVPDRHTIPTGPVVSGALVAGGVVLLVLDRKGEPYEIAGAPGEARQLP